MGTPGARLLSIEFDPFRRDKINIRDFSISAENYYPS